VDEAMMKEAAEKLAALHQQQARVKGRKTVVSISGQA
jgi:hypothetical protein